VLPRSQAASRVCKHTDLGHPCIGRLSKLVSLTSTEYLRIAGSAFLVDGIIHSTGQEKMQSRVYEGPCMLPATPTLYWCTTDVKVELAEHP
jgi:hypothetical protein